MKHWFSPSGSSRLVVLAVVLTACGTGTIPEGLDTDDVDGAEVAVVHVGGRYSLVGVASGKCLEVSRSDDGADVHIAGCSGNTRQSWQLEDAGGGYFRLRNEGTSRCMDVESSSTRAGARIIQRTCSSAASQQLRLGDRGNDAYELTLRHSSLTLDVEGARTADGAGLIQWSRTGRGNQQFRAIPVTPVDPSDPVVCDAAPVTPNPFGCELAWGTNGNGSNRSSYLDFITTWVGYEPNGGIDGRCDGCGLVRALASANAMPTYYAYLIGFQASAAGYGDCNTDFDGQNLCNRGAQWLRSNRAHVISMYANYARMTREAGPNARVLWLLEGDFIQYTYPEQSAPFSMEELGELTSEIICAIKANQPKAIVALNHSSWIRNPALSNYFSAMPMDLVDLVWTTGLGNADGYLNRNDAYGRVDGTYAYLRTLTGKNMFVDTSFGASQQSDSWTTIGATTINRRIADGVIAVNVTSPASDYQSRITALAPSLNMTCR